MMTRVWRLLIVMVLMLSTTGCNQATKTSEDWTVSSVFSVHGTTPEGPIEYLMRGEEGRYGFIDAPFIAGKRQKYMWHFWSPEFAGKRLQVTGVKKETGEVVQILTATLGGANLGAAAHTPSMMSLPTPGLWRLNVSVDDKPVGSIVVDVRSE